MVPGHSKLYKYTLESTQASFPRYPGSVAPGVRGDALRIAYRKYVPTRPPPTNAVVMNLVFMHGTGMNKGIWHSHINKLYEKCWQFGIHVNIVLAMDTINHGDSAQLNEGKLGKAMDWRDVSYDAIELARAESDVLLAGHKNILVGHSMGGFVSLYTTFLQPALFDALVMVNPVCYIDELAQVPFDNWASKGYMETEFRMETPENWQENVFKYMRSRSFFRQFDNTVLENMMADDMPGGPVKEGSEWIVRLKTTKQQALYTYYGGIEPMKTLHPIFKACYVPSYRILGSLDTATIEAQEKLAKALPKMKTINLEGEKHNLHGIHPDLFVETVFSIMKDVKFAPKPVFPFHGPNLRLNL